MISDQITGDESFYFNENGELVIVFDEYTVAPGYMGVSGIYDSEIRDRRQFLIHPRRAKETEA